MSRGALHFMVSCLIASLLAEPSFAQEAAQVDRRWSSAEIAAAPEREYVYVPRETRIDFTGPEAVPFARVRPGAVVQFVLDRDVFLGGVPVVHAGIPTAGVAMRVLHGSRRGHRDGQMQILVTEMVSGRVKELLLTAFNPEDSYAEYPDISRDYDRVSPVKPLIFLGVALLLLLAALHD